jgi:hypothetical protein
MKSFILALALFASTIGIAQITKSAYADRETAINVKMQLLNCAQGGKMLALEDPPIPGKALPC